MTREKQYLYLAVSNTVVSSALIKEEEEVQKLVYYTGQAFQGAEANYPRLKKIAFALVSSSKKLRPYFQAHPIVVMADQPIRKTMNKIDAAEWLVQRVIDLGQFDIECQPQVVIEAQILEDFITKFTHTQDEEEPPKRKWTIQVDGSTTKKAGGAGIVLTSPEGEVVKYVVRLQLLATKNETEYEALLMGLKLAKALEAKDVIVQADSKLVIGQVEGDYEAKEERMQKYLQLVQQLLPYFDDIKFYQIPRANNMEVDFLVRLASSNKYNVAPELCMEIKEQPSTKGEQVLAIKKQDDWMTPIIHFLTKGQLPEDKTEARKV